MDRKKALTFHCSVEATIAVLGGKYKAIIIWHLNVNKIMRYNEIQKAIPQATAKMLSQQLKELEAEGGITARSKRYYDNNRELIRRMKAMGIRPYIDSEHQGPIITTFFYPEGKSFSFDEMYHYIKDRGYAIYPGKVTDADTFRIGNIGEIYLEDIDRVCGIMEDFFKLRCREAV